MKNRKIILLLTIIIISAITSMSTTLFVVKSKQAKQNSVFESVAIPTTFTGNESRQSLPAIQTDFTLAAERSVHAVVHVKTKYKMEVDYNVDPFFNFFFGRPDRNYPQQEQMASGSGVIISHDGYIVTNNHVIKRASEIEVTLNDKRTFLAKVIGADASTDIALLKIEADNLSVIPMGDSDALKIGEWVLAVGNPFNLTSTVTAGIVSAKARNINILDAEMKIESFIQTDAAVNPGNSGGALVNTQGELVGINTAIASQTGSYSGYSFAVPVSIVGKVVADLKEFGVVQRAILGIEIRDITDEFAKTEKLTTLNGVYVSNVQNGSAAQAAGIKKGDIITKINDVDVRFASQLQEQVGRYRPGDKIKVAFIRQDKKQEVIVELKNRSGSTGVIKAADMSVLGATFAPISEQIKYKFRLNYGLQVTSVDKGGAFVKAGIQKGFIMLKMNNVEITSADVVEQIMANVQNNEVSDRVLFISGIYTNGRIAHFAVDLSKD